MVDEQMNDEATDSQTGGVATAETGAPAESLDLKVNITEVGPCRKHITVQISEQDITDLREKTILEVGKEATVPGFRPGKVPASLLARRFKKEISTHLKQQLLTISLQQVSAEYDIEPISDPDIDFENLEVPDEGDFEFEVEMEVRPQFALPDYTGMELHRPVHEVTDEDIAIARQRLLARNGQIVPHDGPAEAEDFAVCNFKFTHKGEVLREFEELTVRIMPTLMFQDGRIDQFDQLMIGAKAGDTREVSIRIPVTAPNVDLRDEEVQVSIELLDVKRVELPELNEALLTRMGKESVEELDDSIRTSLERQVTYTQRRSTRQQVLEKITESANWALPEKLVEKHAENAWRREYLEMQQGGFSREYIQARENDIRQKSLEETTQALKEHFVLDRIAHQEEIECEDQDIEMEILYMAFQENENPRKLRARLAKSGMLENLEAQIRERKVVDFIISKASFIDEPMEDFLQESAEGVNRSITSKMNDIEVDFEAEEEEDSADEE